jgi:hypothetical protein
MDEILTVTVHRAVPLPLDEMPEMEWRFHATGFRPDRAWERLTITTETVVYESGVSGPALTPKGALHTTNRGDNRFNRWDGVPVPPEVAAHMAGQESLMALARTSIRNAERTS